MVIHNKDPIPWEIQNPGFLHHAPILYVYIYVYIYIYSKRLYVAPASGFVEILRPLESLIEPNAPPPLYTPHMQNKTQMSFG